MTSEKTEAPEKEDALTPDQERIRALEAQIAQMTVQMDNLKAQGQGTIMTKVVVKPPDDYNSIIRTGQRFKDENTKLKKIIAFGNISTLDMLIEEYTSKSKPLLKRIATEIQLTNYDSSQIKSLYDFIDYLDYVSDELSSFLAIHEEGKFTLSPTLRSCQLAANTICKKLSRKSAFGKVKLENQEMLHITLTSFIDTLDACLGQKEK